jgi:hypothetical protein
MLTDALGVLYVLCVCRSLRFEDKPDYAFLRRMFRDLFAKEGECTAGRLLSRGGYLVGSCPTAFFYIHRAELWSGLHGSCQHQP